MPKTEISLRELLLIFLFILPLPMPAQDVYLDSLRSAFYAEKQDSLKWEFSKDIAHRFLRSNLDSVLHWNLKGHEIALASRNNGLLGNSYHRLGLAYYTQGEYQQSLKHFNTAITLFGEIGDEERLHYSEFEMAQVYREQGAYEDARKYIDQFYQFYKSKDDGRRMVIAMTSYGTLFEKLGESDSVLHYSEKALEIALAYEEKDYVNLLYTNLAAAYYYEAQFDKALDYSKKARKLAIEQDDRATLYYADFVMGAVFGDRNQTDSSLFHYHSALDFARAYGELKLEVEMTELLAQQYEKKRDFPNAYRYQKEAKSLGDSLAQKKYDKQASELNIKYETQQKETQIALQEAALNKAAYRRNLILLLGLVILSLAGAGFIIYRIRQSTRQKLIETELKNQQKEAGRLKELDQLKSHFFANISHEFRTPLSLILGPLQEMRKGSLKGDMRSFQDLMIRNGERLLSLVNQLLELSKLESGQLKLQPKAGDVNRFIRTMVHSFESLALKKEISFQTSFNPEPVLAYFDPDKLEKIISNLLSNAFKFSPQGGEVSFRQNLLPSQDAGQVRLECIITDNGPGIKEEEMEFVFQRFYTKSADESKQEGIGIGLALARELVELFEGEIRLESEEGKGSSFQVLLNLPKAHVEEIPNIEEKENTPPLISASEISKSKDILYAEKPLLLIVEDNADMRLYLWEQLKDPYQIISASSAEEGLRLAKNQIPDLIISDWMLPGMEGTELIHEIRSDFKTSHVPVIMLTAKSSQEDLMEGIQKGADAFVSKPFEADELKLRIEKLIEQRKNLQEVYSKIAESGAIQITAQEVESQEEAFLRKLLKIIEAELDNEAYSIPEMSKEIGMSRSQLHRKLKALTDKSPSAFLRSVRLQHAHELLRQKSGNISEIALQVGIPNLSYFSRVFSEQFGYPPSEILQNS